MQKLKAYGSIAVAAVLIVALNSSLAGLPPLGRFFSPFTGFLQNTESAHSFESQDLSLPGISKNVEVKYDDNQVPHIFAENEEDLYYTQGYLTAKDRLWQMEFYPRVAAGRLTEMVGAKALDFDKYNRHLGMAETAKKIAENVLKDPKTASVLNAYAAGVNAYIETVPERKLPVEYKFFGTKPEKWTPEKTILTLMAMRNTLNGGSSDYAMAAALTKFGKTVVNDLFPSYPEIESPIIPSGTPWNFKPLPVPPVPQTVSSPTLVKTEWAIPDAKPEIGSNNWVIGGSKSATGLPILANDPHLGLTLPSIWYQTQLCIGKDLNVYGVSLPGTPGIIIGFNKDISWGVTNVGSDVMDFYHVQFKDSTMSEYLYDGKWTKTTKKPQEYFINGQSDPVRDTIIYTHHGPIIANQGTQAFSSQAQPNMAMKWVGNETSGNDMMTFYYLNRAKNYDDYRAALKNFTAPAQNFIFASNQNDIAITPNGKLPLKWKEQGKYLLDGSLPEHDWQGWIPADQNPTVKNPPRGFVSSANQFSTDPSYPYYLGWQFASYERGKRINDVLANLKNGTKDSLQKLQNDNYNLQAEKLLPLLIKELKKDAQVAAQVSFKDLEKWNLVNDAQSVQASVFETWVNVLMDAIWDEFKGQGTQPTKYPSRLRTWALIEKTPTSVWFDDHNTPKVRETMPMIVKQTFHKTIDSLTAKFGPYNPETWAWNKVKNTSINHLVPAFGGFSRKNVNNGGGANCVNASTSTHGPSWRMIVQTDKDWPKAYGLYPGGQSGNPGSKYYDNMVESWAAGQLNELVFLKNKEEKHSKIQHSITIKKQS